MNKIVGFNSYNDKERLLVHNMKFYKTQMGTTLLRIAPIHLRQPRFPLVPGYGYFNWPIVFSNFWPFTFQFCFLQRNFPAVGSAFRFAFPEEVSNSVYNLFADFVFSLNKF